MNLLNKYQQTLAEQVEPWGNQAVLIFRGQSDKSWKLDSGADRRLEKETQPPSLTEYLNKVLIEPARSEGYAHQENRNLNDLELLAKLQHHGAATCLIDFTANFHIALWFSCADEKTDSKVFVVNRGDTQNFKEVTPERAEKGITELLLPQPTTQQPPSEITPERKKKRPTELSQSRPTTQQHASLESQPEIYYWKPPANENRIVVQHSCFIFSAQPIKSEIYKEVSISKEHKQEIRMLLQKYYGLDRQSIFRDFGGFAKSQGQDEPITPIDPTSEQQSLRSGNRHFQQGNYDKAIEDYNKAIRINPQCAEAYTNRGTVKVALGQHNDAIADYDQAIRINPHDAQAYYNRGTAKGLLGRHDDAVADYDQAIRINPHDAQTYTNRGTIKAALGRHDDAIADYDQAIHINPQIAEIYYNRANAKDVLGRHEEAIADYKEAVRINPQYAEAYCNKGIAHIAIAEYQKARADVQRALKLATEQGNQQLTQDVQSLLDQLPPVGDED